MRQCAPAARLVMGGGDDSGVSGALHRAVRPLYKRACLPHLS